MEYVKAFELRSVKDSDDQIIGFVGVRGRKIEMLFLHPEARGKGSGKLLLNIVIENS